MKLKDLYPTLTPEERETLAAGAGIKPPYLWQLANGWDGRQPSFKVMVNLTKADKRLTASDLFEEFAAASKKAA